MNKMTRRILAWLWREWKPSAIVLVLFGGVGVAVAGINTLTVSGNNLAVTGGSGPTANVSNFALVDARVTADCPAYTVPTTDTGALVTVNSAIDCTVTLPTHASPFATGTTLTVQNISNSTAVPVNLVGVGRCATPCAYTAVSAGDLIRVFITYGSSGTVSSLTDSPNGDTCTAVTGTATTSGANGSVMFSCPNIAASGAQTFTATISGSPTFNWLNVREFSGAATTSPDDQGAATGGTLTAPTLATAGNMAERGEWIDAGFNNVSGATPTIFQTAYASDSGSGGEADAYIKSNGAAQYTFNWTSSGATYTAAVAGIKPAHPISVINLCPGAGYTISGPTASACSPLPAGFSANITVLSSTAYQVTVIPPAEWPMDDWTASANVALVNCRETMGAWNFNTVTPIVITAPAAACGDGGTVNIEQLGTAKYQVAAGSGLSPLESPGGATATAGNVYSGGPGSWAFLNYRASGGAVGFGGTTSPTNP